MINMLLSPQCEWAVKTCSHCNGNGIIFIILVSLPLPSWMGSIPIHDGNGNGKNGYHGDQLECVHCRCRRSVNEPFSEGVLTKQGNPLTHPKTVLWHSSTHPYNYNNAWLLFWRNTVWVNIKIRQCVQESGIIFVFFVFRKLGLHLSVKEQVDPKNNDQPKNFPLLYYYQIWVDTFANCQYLALTH